jgi:hypothetical protein
MKEIVEIEKMRLISEVPFFKTKNVINPNNRNKAKKNNPNIVFSFNICKLYTFTVIKRGKI